MRIRPGRTRSLFAGIMMLLVVIVGLVMMSRFGGMGGFGGPFMLIWVVIGLVGAAMAFYNAFSKEGLPIYEVDVEGEQEGENGDAFCPQCGQPVAEDDRFCRHCGASLEG